jgi:ubiquinone/menaquinone biosynthesis C-methylase UbiE
LDKENKIRDFSARHAYNKHSSIVTYETDRFSGWMGKHRWLREQKAIGCLIRELPQGIIINDCPCGTGRWWEILFRRASKIIAMDISETMLKYANERAKEMDTNIKVQWGDAEKISLADDSVDYVFSHALTKHLPIPIQYKVLGEFSRISRLGVICSFGIFTHLTYEFWRRRHLEQSYPIFYEELEWMAESANLEIVKKVKCTTLIGIEHSVLFKKIS